VGSIRLQYFKSSCSESLGAFFQNFHQSGIDEIDLKISQRMGMLHEIFPMRRSVVWKGEIHHRLQHRIVNYLTDRSVCFGIIKRSYRNKFGHSGVTLLPQKAKIT